MNRNLLLLFENIFNSVLGGNKVQENPAQPPVITTLLGDIAEVIFPIEKSPRVIFVNNIKNPAPILRYGDLPHVSLTDLESQLLQKALLDFKKNPKFYDGLQIMATGAYYFDGDEDTKNCLSSKSKSSKRGTIVIEAVQVRYSLIEALRKRIFPHDSPIYRLKLSKMGVLAPLIVQGDKIFFMRRSGPYQLMSSPAGFLEPCCGKARLNNGFIVITAKKEAGEEVLAGKEGRIDRTSITKPPRICSFVIRKGGESMGTMDFVVPLLLEWCSEFFIKYIFKNSEAPDREEHGAEGESISVDPCNKKTIEFLKREFVSGFLICPLLVGSLVALHKKLPHRFPYLSVILLYLHELSIGYELGLPFQLHILIPVHNRNFRVDCTMHSIFRYENFFTENMRLIIFNNGCNANTQLQIKNFLKSYPKWKGHLYCLYSHKRYKKTMVEQALLQYSQQIYSGAKCVFFENKNQDNDRKFLCENVLSLFRSYKTPITSAEEVNAVCSSLSC